MKNICLLVGNGFNLMLNNIIENEINLNSKNKNMNNSEVEELKDLQNKFLDQTNLWKEFDDIFNSLKSDTGINSNDEEMISIVYTIIELLSIVGNKAEKYHGIFSDEIHGIQRKFNELIGDKINSIIKRFYEFEETKYYSKLKSLFYIKSNTFADEISKLLKDSRTNLKIFTTNYDGIMETLLNRAKKGVKLTGELFITKDGFGTISPKMNLGVEPDDYLCFYEKIVENEKHICVHLHGSYKFVALKDNKVFKSKKFIENSLPVIVFNSPLRKKDIIEEYSVLDKKFEIFKNSLNICKKLIIIGSSLESDPHIVRAIIENVQKKTEVKIISYDKFSAARVSNILKTHGFKGKITVGETKNIKSPKELLSLFKKEFYNNIFEWLLYKIF